MAKNYKLLVLLISLCAAVVFGGMTACSKFIMAEQKFEEVTYELGVTEISSDPADYISASEKTLSESRVILDRVDLSHVGSYRVICRTSNHDYAYMINIVDTTAPEISIKDSSSQPFSTFTEISASDIATTTDLSSIDSFVIVSCVGDSEQTQIVDGKAIIEEEGSYELTIESTDEYGNESEVVVTIEVCEPPHFLMLSDRLYDIGNHYGVMDFVFAEDRYGNDITENITVIDDGGYDGDSRGSYEVTYEVTDGDGLTSRETITIRVGLSNNHSLGFEDTDFIPFYREHGYFTYDALEGNEDLDALADLTCRSSFAVKNNAGWCSSCLLRMTDDYMYFLTNNHCISFFTEYDQFYLVDYEDNRFTIYNSDVEVYTHPVEDVIIFRIPIDVIEPYYLLNYCAVLYDESIWSEIGPGTAVCLNAQQWGWTNRNDIVESTTLAEMNLSFPNDNCHFMRATGLVGTPGTSGCPIFTYEGYLVGICFGSCIEGDRETSLFVRLIDIAYLVNSVEFL